MFGFDKEPCRAKSFPTIGIVRDKISKTLPQLAHCLEWHPNLQGAFQRWVINWPCCNSSLDPQISWQWNLLSNCPMSIIAPGSKWYAGHALSRLQLLCCIKKVSFLECSRCYRSKSHWPHGTWQHISNVWVGTTFGCLFYHVPCCLALYFHWNVSVKGVWFPFLSFFFKIKLAGHLTKNKDKKNRHNC